MAETPRVTFVGHDASRTGAPRLLASLLASLDPDTRSRCRVVLLRGGPLVGDYESLVDTTVVRRRAAHPVHRVAGGLRSVGLPAFDPLLAVEVAALRAGVGSDVVVANSLAALAAAVRPTRRRAPLVCHVHELDGVAERLVPAGHRRERLLAAVDLFIAAGSAVGEMLVGRWGVAERAVVVIDPAIDPAIGPVPGSVTDSGSGSVAAGAHPGRRRPLVLGVGAVGARKGLDHFVDLVGVLRRDGHDVAAAWLGGDPASAAGRELAADIALHGLEDHVHHLRSVGDPGPHLAAADVVVSTSREDPFPLSVLEAAAAGVAVAGLDSGGLRSILHAAGVGELLAPAGDVIGLADRVGRLLDDPAARARSADRLRRWVVSTHTTNQIAPVWWAALTGVAR